MAVAFLNVNLSTTHIDEIREFVMVQQGIHTLAINETKLSSDIADISIAINDFTLKRLDRNEHGGGIAFYIKDTINYKVLDNLPEHSIELICLEIFPKKAQPFFLFYVGTDHQHRHLTSLMSWETI